MQSLCQKADVQLNEFFDTLHLECLEMYEGVNSEFTDGDNEKNNMPELPQVSTLCVVNYYKYIVLCYL